MLGFVTESTAVARRELGAEPYRISPPVLLPPFGPIEPCDDEEVDDGYMAFSFASFLVSFFFFFLS